MAEEIKQPETKDGLALIVGGLFILALVFATYNYFNSNKKTNTPITEKIKEIVPQDEKETVGDINGNGAKVENKTETKYGTEQKGTVINTQPQTQEETWVANDYNMGDIKGNSYNVKDGDTLWEIAEGRYGNGEEWTKILDSNISNVSYLPNGEHSLIYSGQTLVLP